MVCNVRHANNSKRERERECRHNESVERDRERERAIQMRACDEARKALLLSNLSENIKCIRSVNIQCMPCAVVRLILQYKVYKLYDKSQIMFELN